MSRRIFAMGNRWLIPYLAFLSTFAPLSTDMYLPALPRMAENLNTSYALASLTVSLFLLLFGLSMLIAGPLSDKYGRRPVLILGGSAYVLSSIGIALAPGIEPLLCWRALQALASGAISAMTLAIVKDLLRGVVMERVVAYIQTVTILAPMLAPVIGGWLLLVTNWRGIFWCLALCGLPPVLGAFALRETRAQATQGNVFAVLGRLGVVLGKPGFGPLLLLFSSLGMPFFAYLAVSSHVFQTGFGLSPQVFSWLFAGNAAVSMLGPLLHMRFFHHWPRGITLACHMGAMALSGGLLLCFGHLHAACFALLYLPVTFCGSAIRPPSTVMLMQAVKGDNGAVTALINAGGLFCGSCAMFGCSLPFWPSSIVAAGCTCLVVAGLALYFWLRGGHARERGPAG